MRRVVSTGSLVGCLGWLALVVAIGLVDNATGPEYGFGFFYLFAVVPAAWFQGRTVGLIVALGASVAWFWADASVRPGSSLLPVVWNASSRGFLFLMAAVLIARTRRDQSRVLELNRDRTRFLRVLERELPRPSTALMSAIDRLILAGGARKEDLLNLKRDAQEMQFLARDFVALGQLQADALTFTRVLVDVRSVLTELVQGRPDRTRVLLSTPDHSLTVRGDGPRIGQAITAILGEAASTYQGDIRIDADRDANEVRVAVSVDVPGDGAELRPSALDDERLVGFELARLIVQGHGGDLSVFRRPVSQGFRVVVRLPAG